jgi:iron complex transport system substrate-binding protein
VRAVTPLRLLALVLTGALLVGACSSSSDDEADAGAATEDAGSGDAFPVTITHAFGETEITEPPERVVTWGWGSADAAIALGVVPVAIPFQEYGGDEQGVLPWIREALEEQGAELPEILPNSEEAPVEAIAAAEPDLILAAYSGLTEEEYELLSEVAPVVAYPEEAWSTPWRELIEIVGTALGRRDEAAALLDEIDAELAAQAEAHPELAGKTVAMVWDTGDTFYVYEEADARVEFALALGLEVAPAVRELETDESTFYFTLSHERLGELESDILVAFADTQEEMDRFLSSAPAQLMPQVREGRVAQMVGTELVASVSPPTALSVTWGIDDYVAELSEAAQVVDQG